MQRFTHTFALAAALLGASSTLAGDAKKPTLDLRVTPRMASPSTEFLFVAELQGGGDVEALYCPTLEWSWGMGGEASVHEEECPPFEPGVSKVERRFSTHHAFEEGQRTVRLALRKDGKLIATASVSFKVTWDKKPPTMSVTPLNPR